MEILFKKKSLNFSENSFFKGCVVGMETFPTESKKKMLMKSTLTKKDNLKHSSHPFASIHKAIHHNNENTEKEKKGGRKKNIKLIKTFLLIAT